MTKYIADETGRIGGVDSAISAPDHPTAHLFGKEQHDSGDSFTPVRGPLARFRREQGPDIDTDLAELAKRASSDFHAGLLHIGLGKRMPQNLDAGLQYAGLGKRTRSEIAAGLQYAGLGKRSHKKTNAIDSSFKYTGLGKRPANPKKTLYPGQEYAGLNKRSRQHIRAVDSGLQYIGLGKRSSKISSGLQYAGLGKRSPNALNAVNTGFQYAGLGRRAYWKRNELDGGLLYVGLGKREIQARVQHIGLGNFKDETKRKSSTAKRSPRLYHVAVQRRDIDPGMMYTGVGKRARWYRAKVRRSRLSRINAAMQHAGLGKRPQTGVDAAMLYAGLGKRISGGYREQDAAAASFDGPYHEGSSGLRRDTLISRVLNKRLFHVDLRKFSRLYTGIDPTFTLTGIGK